MSLIVRNDGCPHLFILTYFSEIKTKHLRHLCQLVHNPLMWRKNGMPAILYPLPKIVNKFNTIVFSGGTGEEEEYSLH